MSVASDPSVHELIKYELWTIVNNHMTLIFSVVF